MFKIFKREYKISKLDYYKNISRLNTEQVREEFGCWYYGWYGKLPASARVDNMHTYESKNLSSNKIERCTLLNITVYMSDMGPIAQGTTGNNPDRHYKIYINENDDKVVGRSANQASNYYNEIGVNEYGKNFYNAMVSFSIANQIEPSSSVIRDSLNRTKAHIADEWYEEARELINQTEIQGYEFDKLRTAENKLNEAIKLIDMPKYHEELKRVLTIMAEHEKNQDQQLLLLQSSIENEADKLEKCITEIQIKTKNMTGNFEDLEYALKQIHDNQIGDRKKIQSLEIVSDQIYRRCIELESNGKITQEDLQYVSKELEKVNTHTVELRAELNLINNKSTKIFCLHRTVYDNELLNHPEIFNKLSEVCSSNKVLELSAQISPLLINEAIQDDNIDLLLGGLMSLDASDSV